MSADVTVFLVHMHRKCVRTDTMLGTLLQESPNPVCNIRHLMTDVTVDNIPRCVSRVVHHYLKDLDALPCDVCGVIPGRNLLLPFTLSYYWLDLSETKVTTVQAFYIVSCFRNECQEKVKARRKEWSDTTQVRIEFK